MNFADSKLDQAYEVKQIVSTLVGALLDYLAVSLQVLEKLIGLRMMTRNRSDLHVVFKVFVNSTYTVTAFLAYLYIKFMKP